MTSSTLRFDHLQHQFEENPRRHFVPLANAFLRAGNAHRAVELCRTFLPQLPGHVSGHVVLAEALRALGAGDDARAEYERVLALDAENVVAVRALGDLAAARGSTMEARGWYARLVELEPRDAEAAARLEELTRAAAEPVAPPYAAVSGDELDERQQAVEVDASPLGVGDPAFDDEFTAGFFASVLDEPPAPPRTDEDRRFASDLDHLLPDDVLTGDALPGADELHATLSAPGFGPPPAAEPPRALSSLSPFDADVRHDLLDPVGFDDAPLELEAPFEPAAFEPAAFATPAEPAEPPTPEPRADEGRATPVGTPIMEEFPEDAEAAADLAAEPGPAFVTETMAELYLRQGFRAEALDVYRQLLAASPHDERLQALVAELARPAAPTPDAPLAVVPSEPVETAEPVAEADVEPAADASFEVRAADEPEPESEPAAQADADTDRPEPTGSFAFGSSGIVEGVAGVEDAAWALADATPPAPTVSAWLSSLVAGEELEVAPAATAPAVIEPTAIESAAIEPAAVEPAAHEQRDEPELAVPEFDEPERAEPVHAEGPVRDEEPTVSWVEAEPEGIEDVEAVAIAAEAIAEPPAEAGAWPTWGADSLLPETDAAYAPEPHDEEPGARDEPEFAGTIAMEPPVDDLVPLAAAGPGIAPAGDAAVRDEEPEAAPAAAAGDAGWDDPFAWDEAAPSAPVAPATGEPFSLDELFARAADPADESAAGALAATSLGLAADDDASRRLEATAAGDAESLGAMLRATPPGIPVAGAPGGAAPTAPSHETPARGSSFSFEQFFRPTPAAGGPTAPATPARPAAGPAPERDEELDEFHRWLEGLSKS